MSKRVFVSYCHRQGDWVWDRLVPVIRAGGAEVLIDRERFEAGRGVVGQMGALQDQAELSGTEPARADPGIPRERLLPA